MFTDFKIYEKIKSEKYIENINENEFFEIMKNHKINLEYPIFRIVENPYTDFGYYVEYSDINIVNPRVIYRKSPYANSNLYNLYLSNCKSWKKYPKRNRSLICGDVGVNNRDGSLMIVIPLEDRKIAVASDDIWYSFKYLKNNLNDFFWNLLIEFPMKEYWTSLKSFLREEIYNREYDNKHLKDFLKTYVDNNFEYLTLFIEDKITRLEFFSKLLSPELNDIKLYNYKDLKYGESNGKYNEIWTDSKSILIRYDIYSSILKKLKKYSI